MSNIRQGRRRWVGSTLCIQPGIHVIGPESKQTAQLDRLGEVAASGVAVIDGLLGQPEIGGERLRGEEMLHMSLTERNHMTAFSIGASYLHLLQSRQAPELSAHSRRAQPPSTGS